MSLYLVPLTPLQRSRLQSLLREVAGDDKVLDTLAELLKAAETVTKAEAAKRIGLDGDKLDWDWVESLRLSLSAAGPEEWSTGEILAIVMGASRKGLWQPRSVQM